MTDQIRNTLTAALLLLSGLGIANAPALAGESADAKSAGDAGEQLARMKSQCNEAAADIARRQAESSLYERLGGRDEIQALTEEIVRLHLENDRINHIFEGVDTERLSRQVTDFMVAGYGGEGEYNGRNMVETHEHLGITDADFLAAGGDIEQALRNLGHGDDEIQEVICSLMPFHEQVVSR
jgi:hemoglobin